MQDLSATENLENANVFPKHMNLNILHYISINSSYKSFAALICTYSAFPITLGVCC